MSIASICRELIAKFCKQFGQLIEAAVDVADDVERTVEVAAVDLERNTFNGDLFNFRRGIQDENVVNLLAPQVLESSAQVTVLALQHLYSEIAVSALPVPLLHLSQRKIQNDGSTQRMVAARQLHEPGTILRLHIRRIDHSEQASFQTLADDRLQQLKSRRRRRLVIRIVGNNAATGIRGYDFKRAEVSCRKSRLSSTGDTDQHDQAEVRK